ncbi:MAG: alpha-galactosidase [Bacteroidales bacterium]|nr:alpha-galactosidase [Bacteroidales bacterium]
MKRVMIVLFLSGALSVLMAQEICIPVSTGNSLMLLQTDRDQRLRTIYFGEPLKDTGEHALVEEGFQYMDSNAGIYNAVYTPAGTWNLAEPAIQVVHADGNGSLDLKYVSHQQEQVDANCTLTTVVLEDEVYPFRVALFYKSWIRENVIEQWAEIEHRESGPVLMKKFASANLYFSRKDFYLTTFHNSWAKEMQPSETKLSRGTRSVDSKLGTRAMLLQAPHFILSFDQPAAENQGSVILGHLAWSGNFKLEFELDSYENLRFIGGINPYASEYELSADQIFKTPSLIYAISHSGAGDASRGLHSWARKYRVLDGEGGRLTLLNNWEATYFSFDEERLTGLFKDARELGVDLFLLDDGWFGNKYPRNSDRAGLGDWQENVKKLPRGIGYLVTEAEKAGVKFGIWIEPEMVNPKSELYENHLDWVIRQPERPEKYFRTQLVLDLSNPEVRDFVFGVVDGLFTENPGLAFIKWDCNAPVFNAYSEYLERNGIPQSHLYIEYVKGLYSVLERVREKYPGVPMMLCSGGGGRGDYELLKYFTEFWPSDNTDPLERVYMQWDYSYFFPAIATDCHVTNWGDQPLKFKVDVASMGKLGFDIVAGELSADDLQFCREAVKNYHSFKEVVWHGDLYRLVNPHTDDLSSMIFVNKEQSRAVVFNYLVNQRFMITAREEPIQLEGLDPSRKYRIREINLFPGTRSRFNGDRIYSGDFLMKVGVNPGLSLRRTSVVLELTEVVE